MSEANFVQASDEHPEYPTVKIVDPSSSYALLARDQQDRVCQTYVAVKADRQGYSLNSEGLCSREVLGNSTPEEVVLAKQFLEHGIDPRGIVRKPSSTPVYGPIEDDPFYPTVNIVPTTKPTNPKDIAAISKVPYTRVPFPVLAEAAVALHEGALKYGGYNWREAGVQASVYIDAVGRHLSAWFEGEDIDPESGLSHVTKAIAGLMVLRDGMIANNWVDDRPQGCDGFIKALNEKMAELNARYPEPKQPFIGLGKERRTYHG